jgi:branched-chain amino acid aminotransferase
MDYQPERGWHHPRIEPYRSLVLDPAAAALHYGQLLFEGLKAFKGKDGTIRAFRPDKHAARMNKGARRICIPEVDPAIVVKSQLALIDVDREWVPSTIGTALYVRTVIIASEPLLGVRPANAYTYFIIMAPVGAYFPEGLNPVKIKVVTDHVRAFPGGLGEVKTGGNYAGGLYASEAAKNEGFTQVLWLDGVHRKYIEECGNTKRDVAHRRRGSHPATERHYHAWSDPRLGAHVAS